MVIKQKCSSRNKTKSKSNTKTKKYKESLRVSSFSAITSISNCNNLSGGGKIKKSRNQQLKTKKTKLKHID